MSKFGDIRAFHSAVRKLSENSEDKVNIGYKGCHIIIDITNVTSKGSVSLNSGESDKADGTVICATVLAGDTVTVNGLLYTAVAGAKADDTEFSVDTGNNETATDLADSIDDDVRVGTVADVVATATTGTVTIVAAYGGTIGNTITLASSDGVTLAVSAATLTGGDDNALISSITCDSIELMSGTEIFDTDLATTAINVAANITAHTSVPNYNAVAVGDNVKIESESGGDTFVVVSTAAVITKTDVDMESNTVAFTLQGKDIASGKYYTILESAVLTTAATTILKVYPNFTASANTIAKDCLPQDFRVIAVNTNDSSITYSVGVNLLK
jgi:hypothetical protein